MPRPRKVELAEVRARALEAFWENGYEATSLSKLEEATDIGRRSLLNTFGDKFTLFSEVLADFRHQAAFNYLSPMEQEGADLSSIEETLSRLSSEAKTPNGIKGCMVCNTAREPIARVPQIRDQVWDYFNRIEQAFLGALREAQRKGQLAENADVEKLAKSLLGVLVSVCTLSRAGASEDIIDGIVEQAVQQLV